MEDKPAASKMESPSFTREQHEGNPKEMLAIVDRNSFHHHDAGAHSNFEPCKTLSSDDAMEIVEPSTIEDDDSPGIELPPGIMDDPLDDLRSNSISSPDGSEKHSSSENGLLLAEEQKMEDIETPHRNDVLCGRGVTTNRWVGNENFRAIVGLNKEMYVTSTKRQKMAISRSIVEAVRSLNPPGRFLDKDPQTGLWYDVGHKKAVEKTSQALRDGAAILRKQLSADLGDPDFLNSVFDEDSNSPEKQNNDAKEKGSGSGKENNKGKSPEKVKPIKAKPSNVKKGHRRVRSNPSVLGAAAAISAARREKIEEPLEDPRHYPLPNYGMFPPAPHSPGPHAPPPRHARSLPNSPMTWGGGPRTSFHPDSPGSFPPHHHHHHQHHSPYHHSPPPTFSPYSKQASHAPYSGSHPFDHHTRGHSSPHDNSHSPRHHSWSPYGSHHPPPYHHPQHHQHYLHPPPPHTGHYPPPPAGGRPTSPSLGHPKYSSNGYYPPHAPTPEWSPRRVNHHPGYHYSPHRGEYTPTRSASWTPRGASPHNHRGDHHHHEDYPDDDDDSGGLSVPSLGGSKSFDGERFSPKVHLTPRMKPIPSRSMETPPRPPAHYRHRAFSPPTSPHLRRPKSKEGRILECSPIEEEKKSPELNERMENDVQAKEAKKTDDVPQKNEKNHAVPDKTTPSNSSNSVLKRDNLPKMDTSDGEEKSNPREDIQQRDSSEIDFKVDDLHETRASPGLFLSIDDDGNVEAMPREDYDDENHYVEDIAMSPLAYDREDPITLMDLPDNLLSLPISPCGPNDDPQPGCFSCLS